ncbi:MAG: redoxin domain-containing protein [Actinobacteria bacterium]|nr:redoxin domain-containing protein [Actinomycetota bacterium]
MGEPASRVSLRVGDPAPSFTLSGVDGRTGELGEWSLSDFAGAPLIIAFYPADDTPVCTEQLKSYTAHIGLLAERGAALVAVSPQDPDSHRAFAETHGGFAFPLLSDLDLSVGRAYGILGLLDLYRRSVFLIDGDGVIVGLHRAIGPGLSYQPLETILTNLR